MEPEFKSISQRKHSYQEKKGKENPNYNWLFFFYKHLIREGHCNHCTAEASVPVSNASQFALFAQKAPLWLVPMHRFKF